MERQQFADDNMIYSTTDYDMFKTLDGNRIVLESRVKKVIASINTHGYLKIPIMVNDDMEVVDGQARLEACKRLKLPVYYIIGGKIGLSDCIVMNTSITKWSKFDYIKSYADTGNLNYIILREAIAKHPNISLNAITFALSGATTGIKIIQEGKFVADGTYEYILDYIEQFVPFLKNISGRKDAVTVGLAFICRHETLVDKNTLFNRFVRRIEMIGEVTTVNNALKKLSDIYNYSKKGSQVHFDIDYDEYLRMRMRAIGKENLYDASKSNGGSKPTIYIRQQMFNEEATS